ncbi:MAG TPA: hypothetical protein V6D09_12320 [Leptolyngbyaceae cyanobacterium]
MASKRKSKTRRRFLIGSGAALVPTARASTALISVTPNFPVAKFKIGEQVSPSKKELHGSRAIVIGAVFNPENSFVDGWWYFLRWVHIPESPWLVGKSDGDCWHESQIRSLSR